MLAVPSLQTLVLELSSICNLRCVHCAYGLGLTPRREPAFIDVALVKRVLDQVGTVPTCYPAVWGEPLMHPHLFEVLDAIRAHATTVVLTTNGTLVTEQLAGSLAQRADGVYVGIPAASAAGYRAMCGVDRFDAAMRGLQLFTAAAPEKTHWIFVVTSINEHETAAAQVLADQMGVHLVLKSAYLLPGTKIGPASTAALSRYQANGVPRVDPRSCRGFWDAMQVQSDGKVTTCCYDFNNAVVVGDATTQHVINDVWGGAAYQTLRENHLAGRLAGFCQTSCGMAS